MAETVGRLRPSQILTTYGPGAIVDLAHLSVIVEGIHKWDRRPGQEPIHEARLLDDVRKIVGPQMKAFYAPPFDPDAEPGVPARFGLPVTPFPRYLICPHSKCRTLTTIESGLFELKVPPGRRESAQYHHRNCNFARDAHIPAIPARFLVACENGHIDDFPWDYFVHGGGSTCNGALEFRERGATGDPMDLWVSCSKCQKKKPMLYAFGDHRVEHLPPCSGRRPWLGDVEKKACDKEVRTITQGASNAYFSAIRSALALPVEGSPVDRAVDGIWADICEIESPAELKTIRRQPRAACLGPFSDDEIYEAVDRRRKGTEEKERDLLLPEWRVFARPDHPPEEDFQVEEEEVPEGFRDRIAAVLRVERLREVRALVGFTRIESPWDYLDDEALCVKIAPLQADPPRWLPAVEMRGEGVFIRLREEAVAAWEERPQVRDWEDRLRSAYARFREERGLPPRPEGFPGARYVLIHSFAHALIRQVSLECGYSAAAIRERIYARRGPEPMAGLLLYTAAPDSEGTLGGLVEVGRPRPLGRHIRGALRSAALCSADPLCAEHDPSATTTQATLHNAACHACLLIAETSCEAANRFLDRGYLVDPLTGRSTGFFAAPSA